MKSLSFPACVQTRAARTALRRLLRSADGVTFTQTGDSTGTDLGCLLKALSRQRGVRRVIFSCMTFPGFHAQLLLAYASRYAHVAFEFITCAFVDYRPYTGTVAHRCRDVRFTRCVMAPDHFSDFVATTATAAAVTRAVRCLGGAWLLTGGSV